MAMEGLKLLSQLSACLDVEGEGSSKPQGAPLAMVWECVNV